MQRGVACEPLAADALGGARGTYYLSLPGGCTLVGKVDGLVRGGGGGGGSGSSGSGSGSSGGGGGSGGAGAAAAPAAAAAAPLPYIVEVKCRSHSLARASPGLPLRDTVQVTLYIALLRANGVPASHALVCERFACQAQRGTRVEWDAALWERLQEALLGVARRVAAATAQEVEALARTVWLSRAL